MRVFIFFSFIFPIVALTHFYNSGEVEYNRRLESIKKATVLLYIGESRGSGTLLKYKNKETGNYDSVILTNAHVCIEKFPRMIYDETYRNTYAEKSSKISIRGEKTIHLEIQNKNKFFSLYKDMCLIRVSERYFPQKYFSFIKIKPEDSLAFAKNKELMMFTRNYGKGEVFVKRGKFVGEISHEFSIEVARVKNHKISYTRSPALISDIDVVPGDSGSALYNSKLELIGLTFGNQLNHQKYNPSQIGEFLASKGITFSELPSLKEQISEINGLHIRLEE